ncbi:hypothetical protein O983_24630 [Mycobacterium avium 09-5983]|nr:hypothetical protein O983_24630 [Mycobacterium avium 09-5983]
MSVAVSSAEPMAVGLAAASGVQGPRLPFMCSSAPRVASSSSGVAKTSRRHPQASNSSSCRLCGSHTIHDHTSGLRVTTSSLTSRGLWNTASEHSTERISDRSRSRSSPTKLNPGAERRFTTLAMSRILRCSKMKSRRACPVTGSSSSSEAMSGQVTDSTESGACWTPVPRRTSRKSSSPRPRSHMRGPPMMAPRPRGSEWTEFCHSRCAHTALWISSRLLSRSRR